MSSRTVPCLAAALLVGTTLAAQVPSTAVQISGAVSALPEALRDGATVLGYSNYHHMVTLREGTNAMICLADDPSQRDWHVACYHKDLEPFMARGRELRDQGANRARVDSVRLAEVQSGKLKMPDHPAALYSLFGSRDSVNAKTGVASGAEPLYVIYMAYATAEATGLPTLPGGGKPWLMYAGKPWAHVMISP
ncbi:MAG TPA: hypothetical protein VLT17_02370 [Gemmatimonadales bacterium]|nr:hypothetical protein [Gemmatimonadales bacterium]